MSVAKFRFCVAAAIALTVLSACHQSPEAKAAGYIEAGKKLLAKNDPSRALLQFRNAIQVAPKNAEAYYQASIAFMEVADVRDGVGALRQTLELNPKHPQARLAMAKLLMSINDPKMLQEARSRLEALVEEFPDDADALHTLALTDLRLGDTQDAAIRLERALAAAPKEVVVAATLAQTKLLQNDARGAEEVLRKACDAAPRAPDAQTILGRFYVSQKRWPEAEQRFQQALSVDANFGPALLALAKEQYLSGKKEESERIFKQLSTLTAWNMNHYYALFLFDQGRKDEGLRELERLWRANPSDRLMRTRLLAGYQLMNRTADAQKVLDAALKKNPEDLDALLQTSELAMAAGRYRDAEADLNQVLHSKPDSAEVHYAIARLNRSANRTPEERQSLYKALELNPFLLPARLDLAQLLIQAKSPKVAIEILDQAPEMQRPQVQTMRNWALWVAGDVQNMRRGVDAELARHRSVDALIQDGLLKLRQGNATAARASLEEALRFNPSDLRALEALAQTYATDKQGSLAVQKVTEYAAQTRSAPVQEFAGLLLWANGDNARARQAFAAAKAADPRFAAADLSLVQIDVLDKKWDDAETRLSGVLREDPQNTKARLWLGNLRAMRGDYKTAMESFRKVVDAEPENADALNNLAYLTATLSNELDDALKLAQKAQEYSPESADIADTLGWILYQKGLYGPAVRQLERAAANESNVVWKYHLAMAYSKAGDRIRGMAVLQAALKKNPNIPEAGMAKQLLNVR